MEAAPAARVYTGAPAFEGSNRRRTPETCQPCIPPGPGLMSCSRSDCPADNGSYLMKTTTLFSFGDQVRHGARPEWGVGSVTKVQQHTANGEATQRVTVRFPNAGLKTLSTAHADLQPAEADESTPIGEGETVKSLAENQNDGWLSDLTEKKIQEKMIELPIEVRDRFNTLERRLRRTLDLYRFDRSGRGIIEWAIAQTSMTDPMTRFNRHELEQFFDRWAQERDRHLGGLLAESRGEVNVQRLLADAPPSAADAVRRLGALR